MPLEMILGDCLCFHSIYFPLIFAFHRSIHSEYKLAIVNSGSECVFVLFWACQVRLVRPGGLQISHSMWVSTILLINTSVE